MRRLEQWARHPHNVRFVDLCHEVERLDFTFTGITGSHHKYEHLVTHSKLVLTPDRTGKAKAYQVRQAYTLVVELGLLSSEEEP